MKPLLPPRIRRFLARRMKVGDDLNLLDRRTRQMGLTFGFSVLGGFTLLIYGIYYIASGNPERSIVDFVFAFITLANLQLLRRTGNLIRATSTILLLMLGLTTFLFVNGGLHGTGFLWMFTIPILAFFLEGAKRGAGWSAVLVLDVMIIDVIEGQGFLQTPYSSTELNQITIGLLVISVMIALFEVITSRYEDALIEGERELQKFKQATDASTDAIAIADGGNRILYVNEAWQKLTGYSSDAARGQNLQMFQSRKTLASVHKKIWGDLAKGKDVSTDEAIRVRRNSQEYAAEVQLYPIREDNKNLFVVELQQDISERKAIDRAKTEFVSLATHQLTTPLAAVAWFAELMLTGTVGKIPPKQRHIIERMEQGTQQMIGLVNELLDSSRVELGTFAIKPQPTDVSRLVRDLVTEIKVGRANDPMIKAALNKDIPTMSVDPNLMRIIVQNLLTNAVRYTPHGKIMVSLGTQGRSLVLTVADTGIGIPAGDQPKIFTKLHRATNAQLAAPNGNGIGLFIVKAIVEASGGSISFTSAEGKGTTFVVMLPLRGMPAKEGNRELSPIHEVR